MKSIKKILIFSLLSFLFLSIAQAQVPSYVTSDLTQTAGDLGYGESPHILIIIVIIIQYILGLIGVLFLVLTIIAGFQWMTAGGNEDTVKKARDRIKNAVYGLVITLGAYIIANTIFPLLVNQLI